jgi:hypothetical protein
MTLRLPLYALPTVLALCALAHALGVAAVHGAWHVSVPLDALTAGGQVTLERLFQGDLGGALEAFAAIFRG